MGMDSALQSFRSLWSSAMNYQNTFKVAQEFFLEAEVLLFKSIFGRGNLNQFLWFLVVEITNVQILKKLLIKIWNNKINSRK